VSGYAVFGLVLLVLALTAYWIAYIILVSALVSNNGFREIFSPFRAVKWIRKDTQGPILWALAVWLLIILFLPIVSFAGFSIREKEKKAHEKRFDLW
jgi:hypothetical protein